MTSYRFAVLRSALGRLARAMAYYWVATRTQLRALRSSYPVQLLAYRIRQAAGDTGRGLRRVPRKLVAGLGLVAWFFGQLPGYLGRVIADRREDHAELRAERRLVAAQIRARRAEKRDLRRALTAERRARRRAQQDEIKAAATKRPHALPVPAWISRMERPERPAVARRVPAPRRALVAAVMTMAAAVPAYAVVTGTVSSGDNIGAGPEATAAPSTPAGAPTGAPGAPAVAPAVPGASAGPATPGPVVNGDTGEFVRTLPVLPTASPAIPAPRVRITTRDGVQFVEVPVVGSVTNPLTVEQEREVQRQARWQAKLVRAQQPHVGMGK